MYSPPRIYLSLTDIDFLMEKLFWAESSWDAGSGRRPNSVQPLSDLPEEDFDLPGYMWKRAAECKDLA